MQAIYSRSTQFDKSVALEAIVERVFASRRITREDQRLFMSLGFVNPHEQSLINRVYEGLHRGILRVVD